MTGAWASLSQQPPFVMWPFFVSGLVMTLVFGGTLVKLPGIAYVMGLVMSHDDQTLGVAGSWMPVFPGNEQRTTWDIFSYPALLKNAGIQ